MRLIIHLLSDPQVILLHSPLSLLCFPFSMPGKLYSRGQEMFGNMCEDAETRWLAVSRLPLGASEVRLSRVMYLSADYGMF